MKGDIRKLRWALPGSGKRGGLRIIYAGPAESWPQNRDSSQDGLSMTVLTTGSFACGYVGPACWGRLRKQIV